MLIQRANDSSGISTLRLRERVLSDKRVLSDISSLRPLGRDTSGIGFVVGVSNHLDSFM